MKKISSMDIARGKRPGNVVQAVPKSQKPSGPACKSDLDSQMPPGDVSNVAVEEPFARLSPEQKLLVIQVQVEW